MAVVLIMLCALFLLMVAMPFVASTTLEAALESEYDFCYDPSGASCTCAWSNLYSSYLCLPEGDYTDTIPSMLSACTGVTSL